MAPRKDIADGLKKATCSYLLRKGYACHIEIGIARFGKRKADVLAVNLKGELVIGEVKSCVSDFTSDRKWQAYLPSCNKYYWIFTQHTAQLLEENFDSFRKLGCGVLALCPVSGYLKCIVPAKYRKMLGSEKRHIITRLAWRSGDISKRNSRRTRVFIGDHNEQT